MAPKLKRETRRSRNQTIVVNPSVPTLGYSRRPLAEAIEQATLEDVKLSLRFLDARQQHLVSLLICEGGEMLAFSLPRDERDRLVCCGIVTEKPNRYSEEIPAYELTKLGRQVAEICSLCQPLDQTGFQLEQLEQRLNARLDGLRTGT